ncbi:AI-2E family transporter YdiK [Buchnera aphidicola (Ceratoglyphina bambusae)]|uniref:AI-2E family transporter YdiK n=1 Tax=Buchnera aphidicola TaxID=9 RepID=UPI0031B87EDB
MKNLKLFMYSKKEIFSLIFIFLMSFLSFLVIKPFIFSFIWSCIIVTSTWPIMLKLQKYFYGKRYVAIIIMVIFTFLFILVPILLFFNILIYNFKSFIIFLFSNSFKFPELSYLRNIPLVGKKIFFNYKNLNVNHGSDFITYLQPYLVKFSEFFFIKIGYVSSIIIQLNFILIFNVFLYFNGEKFLEIAKNLACRISYRYGNSMLLLVGKSIRTISLVILVTTIVQTFLGWIGLIISEIPNCSFFLLLISLFCFIQLGPLPILIPLSIWLFLNNNFIFGTILLFWSFFICILDNILRPILIRLGIRLPFLLILSGVIGGLISFGVIGVFIGPIILVVMHRLILSWIYNRSSISRFF